MKRPWGLALFLAVFLGSPGLLRADDRVRIDFGALVTAPPGTAKAPRVTINRGKRAGLSVGTVGQIYPMRVDSGSSSASVDFNVRLAVGKVVALEDDSATLALEAVSGTVEVGNYFGYSQAVSKQLSESALFRVTALGVELRQQYEDKVFATVEDMLADPSPARRDRAIDAMIADIKGMRAIVVEHLTNRVEEGKYHGKLPGEIVDLLDREQMRDFLLFVEGFPGKYIGHRWKLPEVYFTWVINGTPSGERDRKLRQAKTTISEAYDAARKGKLDDARRLWKKVLQDIPDHEEAKKAVASIERIQLLDRQVKDDPDDTTGRYSLMDALFDLGAYDLAMVHHGALVKAKYDPFKVERFRAQVMVRQEKWKDAEAIFVRLTKERPDDGGLKKWLDYARAKGGVARAPKDPKAHIRLAEVQEDLGNWDNAISGYRKALEQPKVSAAMRKDVQARQERISIRKELDERLNWARSSIKKHELKGARDRIQQALALTDKLGDAKRAGEFLAELSEQARMASEEELALELFELRMKRTPKDIDAHEAYAFALLGFDRLDDADKVATAAMTLDGDKHYLQLIRSHVARARGDLATMESFATKAAESENYPWPRLNLLRAEAARDNWPRALDLARRALELSPDTWEMRFTHQATTRGLQAYEALQADPSSARERLRLIRALADLGLAKRVEAEIARLPESGSWRKDAWWALAISNDSQLVLDTKLQAARRCQPDTAVRKNHLARLELKARLRKNPGDQAARIELGRRFVEYEAYDSALAILAPLITDPPPPAVGDLVHNARRGIDANETLSLARAASHRRDFDGAIRLNLEAAKVFDSIGATQGRITARSQHHFVLRFQGKYKEAITIIEEAIAIATEAGEMVNRSDLLVQLGWTQSSLGTNEPVAKALEEGRKLCEDLDEEQCLYGVYLQLASLELNGGRTAGAIEYARKAWTMADRIGQPNLGRDARFQLADANLVANRLSETERLAKDLLVDSRKAEDVINEQYALLLLGAVAANRGQGAAARARFQEVYDLGTRTGTTDWRALARRLEGETWMLADHDDAKAIKALEHSAELYDSTGSTEARGGVLILLANARLRHGEVAKARSAAQEAATLAQRYQRDPSVASSERVLALVAIAEKKPDEAMKHAQAALDIAKRTDSPGLSWNSWHAMAKARVLKGDRKGAIEAYESALDHLSRALLAAGGESDREGYMNVGEVRDVYREAIALLLEAGQSRRAMELLELSRDARLKQTFDPASIETKDAKLAARLDSYKEKRAEVQGLQKQLESAMAKPKEQRSRAQVEALGKQIAKSREELQQVVLDLKLSHRNLFQALSIDPQNLVARRDDLPPGSVVIEYFVAEEALYAFVISAGRSQPAVVQVAVKAEELEKTVGDFRYAIAKEPETVADIGRKLDDWLLEPVRPYLDGANTLVIMPFGPLYYLPFDALVVSGPKQPVRYAVEDFRIAVQTATTLERLLDPAKPRAGGTLLAVANPDGSLPSAQREVNRIVTGALPDAKVLERKSATVESFRTMAGAYRYLHLATHGVLDRDPRKTHLKLSDGPLTVHQIAGLQGLERGNELVVLSACDTAVEKGASTGDELVSLAFAFAMAGSPALVASLWEVGDASTAELMATFYRALQSGSGDRLDALRNAKLNLLRMERAKKKPYAAPWHWASFQLYGDYRTAKP